MLKINSIWTQGLPPQDKPVMEQQVKDAKIVLDRLVQMLYNMQEKRETTVLEDYDTPSWSHKQAHLNGQAAMLRQLMDMLVVRERDDQSPTGA